LRWFFCGLWHGLSQKKQCQVRPDAESVCGLELEQEPVREQEDKKNDRIRGRFLWVKSAI
jgi:hypothetical protein